MRRIIRAASIVVAAAAMLFALAAGPASAEPAGGCTAPAYLSVRGPDGWWSVYECRDGGWVFISREPPNNDPDPGPCPEDFPPEPDCLPLPV